MNSLRAKKNWVPKIRGKMGKRLCRLQSQIRKFAEELDEMSSGEQFLPNNEFLMQICLFFFSGKELLENICTQPQILRQF